MPKYVVNYKDKFGSVSKDVANKRNAEYFASRLNLYGDVATDVKVKRKFTMKEVGMAVGLVLFFLLLGLSFH